MDVARRTGAPLVVSLENATFERAAINHRWATSALGPLIADSLLGKRVSCVGYIGGEASAVAEYARSLADAMEHLGESTIAVAEQALHNFLLHARLLPSGTAVLPPHQGVVHMALGAARSPAAWLRGGDIVLDASGTRAAVLHQWDRHDYLVHRVLSDALAPAEGGITAAEEALLQLGQQLPLPLPALLAPSSPPPKAALVGLLPEAAARGAALCFLRSVRGLAEVRARTGREALRATLVARDTPWLRRVAPAAAAAGIDVIGFSAGESLAEGLAMAYREAARVIRQSGAQLAAIADAGAVVIQRDPFEGAVAGMTDAASPAVVYAHRRELTLAADPAYESAARSLGAGDGAVRAAPLTSAALAVGGGAAVAQYAERMGAWAARARVPPSAGLVAADYPLLAAVLQGLLLASDAGADVVVRDNGAHECVTLHFRTCCEGFAHRVPPRGLPIMFESEGAPIPFAIALWPHLYSVARRVLHSFFGDDVRVADADDFAVDIARAESLAAAGAAFARKGDNAAAAEEFARAGAAAAAAARRAAEAGEPVPSFGFLAPAVAAAASLPTDLPSRAADDIVALLGRAANELRVLARSGAAAPPFVAAPVAVAAGHLFAPLAQASAVRPLAAREAMEAMATAISAAYPALAAGRDGGGAAAPAGVISVGFMGAGGAEEALLLVRGAMRGLPRDRFRVVAVTFESVAAGASEAWDAAAEGIADQHLRVHAGAGVGEASDAIQKLRLDVLVHVGAAHSAMGYALALGRHARVALSVLGSGTTTGISRRSMDFFVVPEDLLPDKEATAALYSEALLPAPGPLAWMPRSPPLLAAEEPKVLMEAVLGSLLADGAQYALLIGAASAAMRDALAVVMGATPQGSTLIVLDNPAAADAGLAARGVRWPARTLSRAERSALIAGAAVALDPFPGGGEAADILTALGAGVPVVALNASAQGEAAASPRARLVAAAYDRAGEREWAATEGLVASDIIAYASVAARALRDPVWRRDAQGALRRIAAAQEDVSASVGAWVAVIEAAVQQRSVMPAKQHAEL